MTSRTHHYLKTESFYFKEIERGEKKFELRKNDRNFNRFDMIHLQEVINGIPTGRELPPLEIKYIFYGGQWGLRRGYCIFNW